jgi:hypothetical protein
VGLDRLSAVHQIELETHDGAKGADVAHEGGQ